LVWYFLLTIAKECGTIFRFTNPILKVRKNPPAIEPRPNKGAKIPLLFCPKEDFQK